MIVAVVQGVAKQETHASSSCSSRRLLRSNGWLEGGRRIATGSALPTSAAAMAAEMAGELQELPAPRWRRCWQVWC